MSRIRFHSHRSMIKSAFTRSLMIGALSLAGVVSGVAPSFQANSWQPTFETAAFAQNFSDQQLMNYSRAVLEIEPLRQAAYQEIKLTLGTSEVPSIACHQPNSLSRLNRQARAIAVRYCNQSVEIVERYNLSISTFNTMTQAIQSNSALADRVQRNLIQLQQ